MRYDLSTLLLPAAAVVRLEAKDADTGVGISGVGFEVGGDRTAEFRELQSQTVFVDHPHTDSDGRLTVFIGPGRYRFVVASTPDSYAAARETSDTQHLAAGQNPTVQFRLRKEPTFNEKTTTGSEDDIVRQLPARLCQQWERQIAFLRHGSATVKIHRGFDSWIEKPKLESILESLDPSACPISPRRC